MPGGSHDGTGERRQGQGIDSRPPIQRRVQAKGPSRASLASQNPGLDEETQARNIGGWDARDPQTRQSSISWGGQNWSSSEAWGGTCSSDT
eukprot:1140367-Heterocapsa_arctica.AAC.1